MAVMVKMNVYSLFFILFLVTNAVANSSSRNSLHQIVILGRHNIRTPLSDSLQSFTTNKWPQWDQPSGYLTHKGALLESYMGNYFSDWIKREGLLSEGCSEQAVYVYASWPQRTRETAKQFVKAAFKQCNNITVHHAEDTPDPNFQPVIHNRTVEFQRVAYKEIKKEMQTLDLTDAYAMLNNILDLNNSAVCKKEGFCDFNKGKNNIVLAYGEEPEVEGPVMIGNHIVDNFLMEFYSGKAAKDVAWGRIRPGDWKILSKLTEASQRLRFRCPTVTRDVAKPMADYLTNIFLNVLNNITILVGHDSTITSTLANLKLKPYELPDQFEKTPIGGKVVFQKRLENGRYYLKIQYVYQTTEQLRNGSKLTLENPPSLQTLELVNCKVNENGMCPWEDFMKILLERENFIDDNTT